MHKTIKHIAAAFGLAVVMACAQAQFINGQVLTATQLNSALAAPSITGGSINGAPIGNITPNTGAFTTLSASGAATLHGVTMPSTSQFYQNMGATVNRVSDRLFVGPAVLNNATNVASQPDWLTTYQLAKGRTYGYVQTSQMSVLNGLASQDSLTTLVVGAQTTGRSGGSQVIAVTGMGVNNQTSGGLGNQAWGGYFEAFRDTGTAGNGGAYGIEVDTMNYVGSAAVTDPYVQSSDQTVSAQLAAGGGFPGTMYPTTVGINFQNNNSTFDKGIVFGSNSITGATGTSGSGIAIALGRGHELQWYGAASTPTSNILGLGTTSAGGVSQQFSDNLVQWMNASNAPIFGAAGVSGSANYILASNATAGNAPAFSAQGADTNISLAIAGKGTGGALLQGGTSGTDAPAGYIGQIVSSDVPTPGSSVTSAAIANVTSASVPAGNWMCYGNVQQIPGASTAIGQNAAWISTASAALPSAPENSGYAKRVTTASSTATIEGMNVGPVFYKFTSSTTVYLSSQVNYSSGTTGTQYGALNCVRFH